MTNEELAKQLVASPHWRWMPRMVDTTGRTFMEYADCGEGVWLWVPFDGCEHLPIEGRLPDLDDPATRGCLLALVLEAWPGTYVIPHKIQGGWIAIMPAGPWPSPGETRGEALAYAVLALYEEEE